jgi:hypothetical protein
MGKNILAMTVKDIPDEQIVCKRAQNPPPMQQFAYSKQVRPVEGG